jgi:hypothetical protein
MRRIAGLGAALGLLSLCAAQLPPGATMMPGGPGGPGGPGEAPPSEEDRASEGARIVSAKDQNPCVDKAAEEVQDRTRRGHRLLLLLLLLLLAAAAAAATSRRCRRRCYCYCWRRYCPLVFM